MSTSHTIGSGMRQPLKPLGITRHFLWSGLIMAGFLTYWFVWAESASALSKGGWGHGSLHDILTSLGGVGLMGVIMSVAFNWLLLTGFLSRNSLLRDRDLRIAELEKCLQERDRHIAEPEANRNRS